MNNSKIKIAGMTMIAALSNINANILNHQKDLETNPLVVSSLPKPDVRTMWSLYEAEVSKSETERAIIAKELRTDFGLYLSKHFDLPAVERTCVDTTWKKDASLLAVIEGLAKGIESGTHMGYLLVNGEKMSVVAEAAREQDVNLTNGIEQNEDFLKDYSLPKFTIVPMSGGKGKVGIKRDINTGSTYLYAELSFTLW